MRKPLWVAVSLMSVVVAATPAQAREVIPVIGLKVEDHSNIKRLQENEVGDTVVSPYVGIEYEEETGDYTAFVDARVDFENYVDEVFDNRTFYEVDAYLDWNIQPGRFTWAVEDYADQYRINIQAPDTPENTQNVNVFATGPDLLLSAGAWEVLLKGRVGNVTYSKDAVDNNRLIMAGSAKRAINDYSALSLDSTLSVIDYDSDYLDDYKVITTGLRYGRDLPYGKFDGAVGYNGFDFDSRSDKNDPYFDVNLKLDLSGSSTFNFSGAFKLTDLALEAFNPLYTRLLDELELNTLFKQTTERGAAGVYRVKRAFGSYDFRGPLFGASVFGFVNQQRYFDNNSTNLDENGVGLSLSYELTEKFMVRGGVSVSDIKYKVANFDVDWTAAEVTGIYNFADNFFMVVGAMIEDSKSDDEPLRDFKDDRLYFAVEYKAQPKYKD